MKSLLKKSPFLYSAIHGVYYTLLFLVEKIIGTRFQELAWRIHHTTKSQWLERAWRDSICSSSLKNLRNLFGEKIVSLNPASVLDIGCGNGSQLADLVHRGLTIPLYGIDVNKPAILFARKKFHEEHIANISLFHQTPYSLKQFLPKSIDVTYTAAVLLYIGPDKIIQIVHEIIRVTRKKIIFAEPHLTEAPNNHSGMGVYRLGYWFRDYRRLFARCGVRTERIVISKIPEDSWGRDIVGAHAYFIEVDL